MHRKSLSINIKLDSVEALTALNKVNNLTFLIFFIFLMGVFCGIANADIKSDLISHWKLDDGSGTIATDSIGSNNGTLMGDAKWAEGWVIGAVELDGDDDYVDCGEGTVFNTVCRDVITLSAWVKTNPALGPDWGGIIMRGYGYHFGDVSPYDTFAMYYHRPNERMGFKTNSTSPDWVASPDGSATALFDEEWHHVASVYDGAEKVIYLDAQEIVRAAATGRIGIGEGTGRVLLGGGRDVDPMVIEFGGYIDDARIYDRALTQEEIVAVMENIENMPYAISPDPPVGALIMDTWVNLSWRPGDFAVSHDVYIGDNPDDVNAATRDSELFRTNQELTFYVAGFPGYAYPDGLVPGMTYYWRIDEVNNAEPNSPWKGEVWSFRIPPKTAYTPVPADSAELVLLGATLTWTPGFGAKLHTIYFGDDFDTVNNATSGKASGVASYTPVQLELAKTYYWRIDEFDGEGTYKGEVWSFTTEGGVSGPNPTNGAADVKPTQILTWNAGAVAASHDVYFGADANAVKNATKTSPEYKGAKALGEESYDPGKLTLNTTYYWRIDEVNSVNPDSPWKGNVWSFTTGGFFVVDDFEDYDVGNNEIWWAWKDGLGYVAHGKKPAFPGNGTGAIVGDETTLSYTEETIVQEGNQAMPFFYDNNKQGYAYYSEAEFTLTAQRDWTEEGVVELSIWFRGEPENDAEPLYIVVSNTAGNPAVIVHDDASAAQIDTWTEWIIPLQAFADQGIVLTDVDKVAIGLGTQGNITVPGGKGKIYIDDIRLYQPREADE